jgi:hypothetical protein
MYATNNHQDDALLTEVDAADLLRLSTRTLQAWRVREVGPPFLRAGRAVRYRRLDIAAWIDANLVSPGKNPSNGAFGPVS